MKKTALVDLHVRLPRDLTRALAKAAEANARSTNAEMIVRLRESIKRDQEKE